MRMEHLEYLIALSKTQSITQTGKELFTTQQNVSKMIRQLEDELNTVLFVRSQKGVELTEAGEIMLIFAQQTINEFQKIQAAIKNLQVQNELSGELHLYSTFLSNFIITPSIVQAFNIQYPHIQLHIYEAESLEVLRQVVLHSTILGILPIMNNVAYHDIYAPYLDEVRLYPLLEDRYICLVSNRSPLAKQRIISLDEFLQHPVVFIQHSVETDSSIARLFQSVRPFQVALASNNQQMYLQGLSNIQNVALSSQRAHNANSASWQQQIVTIPFKDDMHFQICFIASKYAQATPIQKAFADFVRQNYRLAQ